MKKIASLITIMGCLLFTQTAFAEKTLRIASWLPPTHPQNATVIPTWGKWIEEATKGRVKIKIEYGMGHPKTMFELVEDGVVDASWSYHGYVPGRFKLTQAVEQPLLGADAEAASVAHWRVHEKYFSKAKEHEGLVLAALFTHGPGQIHMAKPIKKLADLKGKKIRLGGGVQGEIGKRLGVTAVGAPATKVYEMMQQGVIDGVFIPMGEQKTLRLKEVAKHVVALPGGMYLGSFSMFINPEFMSSLSDADQKAIMSVSGEKLSALAGKTWTEADSAGYKAAKEDGVSIVEVGTDDPISKEFQTIAKGMDDAWVEHVKGRKVEAAKALEELRVIARDYGKGK